MKGKTSPIILNHRQRFGGSSPYFQYERDFPLIFAGVFQNLTF